MRSATPTSIKRPRPGATVRLRWPQHQWSQGRPDASSAPLRKPGPASASESFEDLQVIWQGKHDLGRLLLGDPEQNEVLLLVFHTSRQKRHIHLTWSQSKIRYVLKASCCPRTVLTCPTLLFDTGVSSLEGP